MLDLRHVRCEMILQSLQAIKEYMDPIVSPDDFLLPGNGAMRLDAITLRLQVIGENVKQIQTAYPDFFRDEISYDVGPVIRFRDFVSHHYEKLDYEIVYDICTRNLSSFENAINAYLNKQ